MRVIAGKVRSLPLKCIEGLDTRPTTDRIKETLFNMIQTNIADARFLDLFGGSGAIGIEALSRGAAYAAFAESNKKAVDCIKENLKFTKLEDDAEVFYTDAMTALRRLEGQEAFDFVYLDPPYGKGLEVDVFTYLKNSSLITEDTTIILEAELKEDVEYLEELGFSITKEKKYRTNKHIFVKYAGE